MQICERTGCERPATHRLELLLFTSLKALPSIGAMECYCCTDHATKEIADSVLTDEGKEQVNTVFLANDKFLPDWDISYAHFIPIDSIVNRYERRTKRNFQKDWSK